MGDDVETEGPTDGPSDKRGEILRCRIFPSTGDERRSPRWLSSFGRTAVTGARRADGAADGGRPPPAKALRSAATAGALEGGRRGDGAGASLCMRTTYPLFSRCSKRARHAAGELIPALSNSAINDTAVGRLAPSLLVWLVGRLVGDSANASAHIVRDMKLLANSIQRRGDKSDAVSAEFRSFRSF